MELINPEKISIKIGSYLYLTLGAYVFCWIIYGNQGLPGQLLISLLMSIYWSLDYNILVQFSLINVIAPILATSLFRELAIYKFKDFKSETVLAILFLCIVLALFNSLSKFFFYFLTENHESNPFAFLTTYLPGDIIGAFVFIMFAKFIMKTFHLGPYRT